MSDLNVQFIAVDWSGALRPKNKIWLAVADSSGLRTLEPQESREAVIDQIIKLERENSETVVGLDFAFSLPIWFVRQRGAANAFEFWAIVEENGEAWLKGCEPPFWGWKGKRRPQSIEHFRETETRIRDRHNKPKSCFQLYGAGAVGTGTLRGIPFLRRLRSEGFNIWPFDTPKLPMVVEIYPRSLTGPVTKSQPHERANYLRLKFPELAEHHVGSATSSDDAFDAAISAIVMARSQAGFSRISSFLSNESSSFEGEIWHPALQLDSGEGLNGLA